MKKAALPVSLGIAHGVSDCTSGLLLGSLAEGSSLLNISVMVLLYNLLAFGAQPLAGLLVDKFRSPKFAVITALMLMCIAVLIFSVNPFAAVILAGLSSALFHTGGGALALCAIPGKASGAGLFAAPGVAGLTIGGYLSLNSIFPAAAVISLLIMLAVIIYSLKQPLMPYDLKIEDNEFEKHDFIMLVLLLAIALRSAVWNIFQHISQGDINTVILISLAAAGGKVLGGFAGDKFGWKRYSYTALLISIPLLILGESSIYFLMPGIALLQSVTPVMVSAIYKNIKRLPATAAGLSFGLAIAAGGLPFIKGTGISDKELSSPYIIAGIVLLTVVLIYYALSKLSVAAFNINKKKV